MSLHYICGLLALILVLSTVQIESLIGQYVCTRIETYEIPITKTAQRPFVVREMVWCMQVPPRCPKIRTEYRIQVVTENITKTRVVSECCEGYFELDSKCLPQCGGDFDGCGLRGRCVAPDICKCDPGFHGATCSQGYDITTTQSSTPDLITTSTKHPFDEDRYNEYNNEITADLSHLTIPIINKTQQSTTVQQLTTTEDTTIVTLSITTPKPIITTTQVIKNFTVDSKSKSKHKSSKIGNIDKIKTKKITTQAPIIENVTESTLILTEHELIENITKNINLEENVTEITSTHIPIQNNTEIIDTSLENYTKNSTTQHIIEDTTEKNDQENDDNSLLLTLTINNETSVHNQHLSFGVDLISAIMLILGASLSLLLVSLLLILACQHKNKVKPQQSNTQQCGTSRRVVHSQLPPTPQETSSSTHGSSAMFSPNNNVVILQHVTMATTNNTFKPAAQQPTISPALREALEAHYDHPPTWRNTIASRGQRSSGHHDLANLRDNARSLSELWDAVVASATSQEVKVDEEEETEHVYDEIPYWRTNPVPPESSTSYNNDMITKC